MPWHKASWERCLGNVRSALAKRDALAGGTRGKTAMTPFDYRRQHRNWSAKARANLRQLARLAEAAPDPARARETVEVLRHWYWEAPAPPGKPDEQAGPPPSGGPG